MQQEHVTIEEHLAAQSGALTPDELAKLGEDIVQECRSALMLRFRFLDAALWRLPLDTGAEIYRFMTDGKTLKIGPMATAVRYRSEPDEVVRDLLHVLLHCIFRHPFDERPENGVIFSVACDVMVEALALELCQTQFPSKRDAERREALEDLRKICPTLAPNKLYRYLYDNVPDEGLAMLGDLFGRDGHAPWACMRLADVHDGASEQKQDSADPPPSDLEAEQTAGDTLSSAAERAATGAPLDGEGSDDAGAREETEESDADLTDSSELDASTQDEQLPDEFSETDDETDDSLAEQEWERIAKLVEVEMQTRGAMRGDGAGSLAQTLALANRQTYDYADFLRRFAAIGEDLRVNDDEFDYIYYTFGLDTYGNMPLVEPLEYQESERVREFVIAIDTSESCAGWLVRTFVQRTYDILKDTASFGDEVNIHIVQCDAQVRSVVKIGSLAQMAEYLQTFTVRGFGGTDFRPVFAYVDELLEQGEFTDLRGLVYFTDGEGRFPETRPAYDAAFVFVNDEIANVRVPPWAMKVILDEDSIRDL